jgi:hypothetical protein
MSEAKGQYLTKEKILEVTNGGLDIITDYFPDAHDALEGKKTHFKIRDEKTPSASIKAYKGIWYVTDFGGDQKGKDCFAIVQEEEGLEDFKEVIRFIGEKYRIAPDGSIKASRPEIEKREATPEEQEGTYEFEIRDEWTDTELREVFPHYQGNEKDRKEKAATLQKYNWQPVAQFSYTKNRKTIVTKATETYPIYIIEGVSDDGKKAFKKIYQPRSEDKQYRFRYQGEKPKDHVFGLKQLRELYNKLNEEKKAEEAGGEEGSSHIAEVKVPEVIICSGDRDSMNVASMGYAVIWLNSETAGLDAKLVRDLFKYAEKVYNLPDLDTTGVRAGTDLALKHLDIATIWLPEKLRTRKDFRGNKCKDVTDFFRYLYRKPTDFKDLLKSAVPARLYNVMYTDKGVAKYDVDNVQCYEFLRLSGFYRMESKNEKTGYIFVRIQGNIVEEVNYLQVKDYVNNFLKAKHESTKVRNTFFRTNQLSESSLNNLEVIDIDFTDFTKDSQFLFFENVIWEIGKDGIKEHKPGSLEKYVWREEVIPHKVKKMDDFFKVKYDQDDDHYSIDIHNKDCLYFQYLMKTSWMHWRKELEERQQLTEDEKYEQELHLINKLYVLGYMLHRYKNPSRPWCPYVMDYKISEQGESHGGSGKSIYGNAPKEFMKTVILDGRSPKLTDNPHIYDRVTVHTDYVLIDDADQYLKFEFFFGALTGSVTVNPKNNKQFEIPFKESPKFGITSNFPPRKIDPSIARRLVYVVFSDYFHHNADGEYQESRSPNDDFGKNLLQDFTEEEWNLFCNLVAQCIKLYLNFDKIDPPMNNVEARNLLNIMTDAFKDWADVYFNDRKNTEINKKEAFDDFMATAKAKLWTTQKFKKALGAWCKFYGHILNPKELCNSDDKKRIIRKINSVAQEMVYISTRELTAEDLKNNEEDLDAF